MRPLWCLLLLFLPLAGCIGTTDAPTLPTIRDGAKVSYDLKMTIDGETRSDVAIYRWGVGLALFQDARFHEVIEIDARSPVLVLDGDDGSVRWEMRDKTQHVTPDTLQGINGLSFSFSLNVDLIAIGSSSSSGELELGIHGPPSYILPVHDVPLQDGGTAPYEPHLHPDHASGQEVRFRFEANGTDRYDAVWEHKDDGGWKRSDVIMSDQTYAPGIPFPVHVATGGTGTFNGQEHTVHVEYTLSSWQQGDGADLLARTLPTDIWTMYDVEAAPMEDGTPPGAEADLVFPLEDVLAAVDDDPLVSAAKSQWDLRNPNGPLGTAFLRPLTDGSAAWDLQWTAQGDRFAARVGDGGEVQLLDTSQSANPGVLAENAEIASLADLVERAGAGLEPFDVAQWWIDGADSACWSFGYAEDVGPDGFTYEAIRIDAVALTADEMVLGEERLDVAGQGSPDGPGAQVLQLGC